MTTRKVQWLGEQNYLGTNKNQKGVLMSGGEGPGVGPMEMLLFGVAGCSMYDVVAILKKQKQPLTGLEVEVDGVRGTEGAKPYQQITLHFSATGNSLDPNKVERAIQLSVEKYCGASATLSGVAKIQTTFECHETIAFFEKGE